MSTFSDSILSHGEQDVAGHLRQGADIRAIAEARGTSEEAVEKAIHRIREKTNRAFATLIQSPFIEECAAELDPADRCDLIETLEAVDQ